MSRNRLENLYLTVPRETKIEMSLAFVIYIRDDVKLPRGLVKSIWKGCRVLRLWLNENEKPAVSKPIIK